tara:strand:+ start:7176 stop:7298 length:123 start_codon:yes stop_codon:yes gene_type:complete
MLISNVSFRNEFHKLKPPISATLEALEFRYARIFGKKGFG